MSCSLLDPAICDGIGLVRSEFLFSGGARCRTRRRSIGPIVRILEWARRATGHHPHPGCRRRQAGEGPDARRRGQPVPRHARHPPVAAEAGRVPRAAARAVPRRGARQSQDHAAHGGGARAIWRRAARILPPSSPISQRARCRYAEPPLGIMVEVPAAAIAIDRFDADFYSIGSNDLTQYVMAAARDIAALSDYADAADPAVLSLIARTVEHGKQHRAGGQPVRRRRLRSRPSFRICLMRACARCRYRHHRSDW